MSAGLLKGWTNEYVLPQKRLPETPQTSCEIRDTVPPEYYNIGVHSFCRRRWIVFFQKQLVVDIVGRTYLHSAQDDLQFS